MDRLFTLPVTSDGCDLCGHRTTETLGARHFAGIPTTEGLLEFQVSLVCCNRCGLIFQEPRIDVEKMARYYATMYREERWRPAEFKGSQFSCRDAFVLSLASERHVRGKALEVGCADGTTLERLMRAGFEVTGIEPSLQNADACRAKGVQVHAEVYDRLPRAFDTFDVVLSYYVIEHVLSPADFLAFCNSCLRDGGLLFLEAPDLGAYKTSETSTDLLFFLEHQTHLSRATMAMYLERSGFELVRFSDQASNGFGMHLAAVKTGRPLRASVVSVPSTAKQDALALVEDYRSLLRLTDSIIQARLGNIFPEAGPDRRVVLFGAGGLARRLLETLGARIRHVAYIMDNNPSKWGTAIRGVDVRAPAPVDANVDLVVVASSFEREILAQLDKLGVPPTKRLVIEQSPVSATAAQPQG